MSISYCDNTNDIVRYGKIMLNKAKLIYYHENKTNRVVVGSVIEYYGDDTKQHWQKVKYFTDTLFNQLRDDDKKEFIDKAQTVENAKVKKTRISTNVKNNKKKTQ